MHHGPLGWHVAGAARVAHGHGAAVLAAGWRGFGGAEAAEGLLGGDAGQWHGEEGLAKARSLLFLKVYTLYI